MVGLPTGTVTFLFSDVEGSTELLQRLGDAYASELHEHRTILRETVALHGGEIVDQRGEETFAAFSEASAAVETAVEIERRHADRVMRVRIGVHTGQPALTGDGYLGLDVHRAARICGAGHGRQILLSAQTRALVADRSTKDLGEHLLKGISAPEHLFQLLEDGLPRSFAALRVLPTARKSRRRPQLRRHGEPPRSLEQLAWAVRARLPVTAEDERGEVSQLAASLIAAARSSTAANRFVASVDRRAIERDLESYRSMSVTSQRASEAADLAARRLTLLEALDERARSLERVARRPDPEVAEIEQTTRALDAGLVAARAAIGTSVRTHRTRRRGIRRLGAEYLVVTTDETGIEYVNGFASMSEARDFRDAVRVARAGTHKLAVFSGTVRHAASDNPYQAGIGRESGGGGGDIGSI